MKMKTKALFNHLKEFIREYKCEFCLREGTIYIVAWPLTARASCNSCGKNQTQFNEKCEFKEE